MRGAAVSWGTLVALLALAAALPATAAAVTHVSVNSNTVRAVSDPNERNEIRIDFDINSSHILVEDGVEGVAVAPPCVIAVSHADCPLGGGGAVRIIARSGNGRDTIEEGLLLALIEPVFAAEGFPPTLFDLGPGNDFGQTGLGAGRIIGGPGNDRMIGLEGPDTLIGGPGNDVLDRQASEGTLEFSGGRDRYLGGPGADKIRARDFTRDLRIDCGRGRDRLSRDRFDPRPSRCP